MSLLIRHAILDGTPSDILIRDGLIESIESAGTGRGTGNGTERGKGKGKGRDKGRDTGTGTAAPPEPGMRVIDGEGLHAFPSLKNAHTHVPMVLFRGYGDDMPLMEWLQTRIWPAEKCLTDDDVYLGARLGILEMIRGGTTFFNEMYWHRAAIVRAVDEMGVRACVGSTILDLGDEALLAAQKDEILELARGWRTGEREAGGRVVPSVAPHAIYTVSPEVLRWVGEVSAESGMGVHMHLSETGEEVERCVEEHGCRPAVHLERLGLVGPRLVAAHGQFLDGDELELLGEAGATIVTNPTANLKLATGGIFPWRAARAAGVRVCLGTDGAASNNNLDLLEEMKMAALVQKHREVDATALPAPEALAMATTAASEAFGLGSGRLEAGAAADLILVDFSDPSTQPLHDPVSALVYAANASHVHTTICAGRVLMHDRRVEVCDEAEVVGEAVEAVRGVLARAGQE
jgi:5-methylthioadenosine/S-adenosylhomocysteine deaminase